MIGVGSIVLGAGFLYADIVYPGASTFSATAKAVIARPASSCTLTSSDLAANARLSFADFDQVGVTSATARKLGDRRCYRQAAEATEHYLVHGPVFTDYQRNVLRWHLGQYLASAGREREAARVVASTRREPDGGRSDFDWNSYVIGTWAFLVKNKPLLDASLRTLQASPDSGDKANARVLGRLSRCFTSSYRVAQESDVCAQR